MADAPFRSFVILAAMRTGSNFLEESLNRVPGIVCLGEAFNPTFIAYPNRTDLLGVTMVERDANPLALLKKILNQPGLTGFRYFPDHDPRVLDAILADRTCAKIVLTRNPAESYVSLGIARETGQWKAKDAVRLKSARVRFDAADFTAYLDGLQGFHLKVLHGLQTSGQTAFYLDYEDIGDGDVLTGLARFLGVGEVAVTPARSLVPQNPDAVIDKVANPGDMAAALARLDRFNLTRTPNFEPRRGPQVPGFIAAKGAPLLFMPVAAGPTVRVQDWLSRLGEPGDAGLVAGFTQAGLRDWMRAIAVHRRFTVLRHPLARAYAAFADGVLAGNNARLVDHLVRQHRMRLPEAIATAADRHAAFVLFLRFLKPALNGQTSLRVDPAWASQQATLAGFARFALPDAVIREEQMEDGLAHLCRHLGVDWVPVSADEPGGLDEIHDTELEALARQACPRDYLTFGFGPWRG